MKYYIICRRIPLGVINNLFVMEFQLRDKTLKINQEHWKDRTNLATWLMLPYAPTHLCTILLPSLLYCLRQLQNEKETPLLFWRQQQIMHHSMLLKPPTGDGGSPTCPVRVASPGIYPPYPFPPLSSVDSTRKCTNSRSASAAGGIVSKIVCATSAPHTLDEWHHNAIDTCAFGWFQNKHLPMGSPLGNRAADKASAHHSSICCYLS